MALLEGIAGLLLAKKSKGTPGPAGLSEFTAAVLVQEAGARYLELTWNGALYTISTGLVATPAAGPLGAAGTPLLALYNPANSGYIAVITRILAGWTATGTVSGKGFELDGGVAGSISAAANATAVANLVGTGVDNDLKGFTNTVLTGQTPASSRIAWLEAIGNATAQNTAPTGPEDLQGLIIVPQNAFVAITAAAAGTANEAVASITYAKLKLT